MYEKKLRAEVHCPIDRGMQMLGGKWKGRILCALAQKGPIRYSALREEMVNITDTALSGSLKELIRDGLVGRQQYNEMPLRVEYELTPYGRSAVPLLLALAKWADGILPSDSSDERPICLQCHFRKH